MNAFERQLAGVMVERAGPVRPVDDAAIFAAITATRSPRSWVLPLFSATRFVVAGAVVALFGGMLLAGVLTQPSKGPAPVGASPRATPRTTDDLLSRLGKEEVAPGVLRIVDDGAGRGLGRIEGIIVDEGATVWTWTTGSIRELGGQTHPGPIVGDLVLAPDGTLWAKGKDDCGNVLPPISSFDGATWTTRTDGTQPLVSGRVPRWPPDYLPDLSVASDGTVWAVGENCGDIGYNSLLRLGPEGWTNYSIGDGLPAWPCGPDCGGGWSTEITPDGTVWLAIPEGGLLRYEGVEWEVVRPLGGDEDHRVIGLAANQNGVLWAEILTDDAVAAYESGRDHERRLARFDGRAWEAFSYVPGGYAYGSRIQAVGPDGAVWLTDAYADEDRREIADERVLQEYESTSLPVSFDGVRWNRYPEVLLDFANDPPKGEERNKRDASFADVFDVAIGPDGTAWVTVGAGRKEVARSGLYVITPGAVAACANGDSVAARCDPNDPSMTRPPADGQPIPGS